MAVAVADSICLSQTPSGASNLTIAGSLATGGVATMDVPRHVSITSGSDESGDTYTITGTDRAGNALVETITGPSSTTAKGNSNFKTVTTVATSGAATGAITVGSADEADTQIFVTDQYADNTSYSVSLSSGASLTYEPKYTLDNIWASGFAETAANWISDGGTKTIASDSVSAGGIRGIRLEVTSWTSASDSIDWDIVTAKV